MSLSKIGSPDAAESAVTSRRQVLGGVVASAALIGVAGFFAANAGAEPRRYLNSALTIMRAHSIARGRVNWHALRREAYRSTASARTIADVYPAIRAVLAQLDKHSAFATPSEMEQFRNPEKSTNQPQPPAPRAEKLGAEVGYISVPWIAALDQARLLAAAQAIQDGLRDADRDGAKRWIVDLRGNRGGNMWPMLLGLAPLLGDGLLGSTVDPSGNTIDWIMRNDAIGQVPRVIGGDQTLRGPLRLAAPYRLRTKTPPVAVLTGPMTASSGEAVTIAFRGRPKTASFGQPTAGYSSSNGLFDLSDGAVLILTTSLMADRLGKQYGSNISPDHEVAGKPADDLAQDAVVQAATAWLAEQSAEA